MSETRDPQTMPTDQLRENELNPRGRVSPDDPGIPELAASIREQGVLQPLLVTPDGTVVAGHRRLAAARLAGLAAVPVTVRGLGAREQLECMLIENLQREDLSPLQEALAFRQLIDGGLTQMDVARRIGLPVGHVQSRLPILKLAPTVQAMYGRNELPVTLARVLVDVADWGRQIELARLCVERGLTVPSIEGLLKRGQGMQASGGGGGTTAGGTPGVPPGKGGPDRGWVVNKLVDTPNRTINFGQLWKVLDAICCACGVHANKPELCARCPLPKYLSLVVAPPSAAKPAPPAQEGARAGA
jgi:ParB/RepB/Spo0J family partition protein